MALQRLLMLAPQGICISDVGERGRFSCAISCLAFDRQGLFIMFQSLLMLIHQPVGVTDVIEQPGLGLAVSKLSPERQRLPVMLQRFWPVAKIGIEHA